MLNGTERQGCNPSGRLMVAYIDMLIDKGDPAELDKYDIISHGPFQVAE